jgi:hypothetical protein
MTSSYETERIAEERDRLAHNPEVVARAARWAGHGGALLLEPIDALGVLSARSACPSESVFIECGPGVGG